MKKVILVISILLLASCAGRRQVVYTNPAVTDQQREWDHFECTRLSQRIAPVGPQVAYPIPVPDGPSYVITTGGGSASYTDTQMFGQCMRGKGYVETTVEEKR